MDDLLITDNRPKKETNSEWIAPDAHGQDFFEVDQSLKGLLRLYLPDDRGEHMTPHYSRRGSIFGDSSTHFDCLSDRHSPVLQSRDPLGRDEDWIGFHPAYREMEAISAVSQGKVTLEDA
jgi:acyl-CoA dehydrogenase